MRYQRYDRRHTTFLRRHNLVILNIFYVGVLTERERRSTLATLCAEALKRREEKRNRERLQRSAQQELCNLFTEYNKDEVPVDVATSLVVNHVNPGALCLLCYIYVYGYVKHRSKKNRYKQLKK